MPNGLETYMSFTSNNKLSFIDSFQFQSSSLDSLVKNLNEMIFVIGVRNLIRTNQIQLRKNDFILMNI